MRKLTKDQTGSKSTVVEGDVAICEHTSVHPSLPREARYQLTWRVDFSNCTHEQILAMAAEHVIIKERRIFKADEKLDEKWDDRDIDASTHVNVRKSKAEKAKAAFDAMSDADKEAFLSLIG